MSAFKLISTSGDQAVDLTEGRPVVVGRAVTSDLPIYDPTVSRRHAEVILRNGSVSVRDLGSSNGTFINGTQLAEASVAQDGDTVTFGKVAFRLREVTPPAAKPPPKPEQHGGFGPRPPEATIVRQLPVEELGNIQARVQGRPSGASQLKVVGDSTAERQSTKLSLLLDISKELSKQQEVDKLLQKVVDITFQVMNVDRVSMLMVEGATGELVPRVSKNRLGDVGGSRHVPQSIARRAVTERLAILTDNAAADERFKGQSILMQSVRSAMCTPLMGSEGKVLGIIYVDNLTATHSFGDEDLEFLIAFSGIAAVAIENSQLTDRVRREAVVLSNFQRYFAPNVAAQIANQQGAIQLGKGERRPVVIFFTDIRGFTPMSEKMGPDEIVTLLTEYFTEMVEIIFEHDGTLDKFIGDAIMAIWGAPVPHEDDADRAIRAAVEMQRVLGELNKKWKEQGRQKVQIGIGINFGEVFAGNIGSDRRLEYTVIGDAVNTASRLCSKAGPGEIIISEPFYRKLKSPPPVEALEPMQLKGKAQAVPVYRVKA
ncbi:MAG TPA: adenylate/guanylate cyclase domain-containing protein [Gemmatimonadales bacterium]|nr:adenylate/guanylate cyclase domain-containing protein [Gemmatimonadales bacterium]